MVKEAQSYKHDSRKHRRLLGIRAQNFGSYLASGPELTAEQETIEAN